MALSLYEAFVPTCIQMLKGEIQTLEKAEAFCAENGVAEETLVNAKLADDMFDFSYQVKSTVVHSVLAVESLENGIFSPDMTPPPQSLAALKDAVQTGITKLEALTEADLAKYEGQAMKFKFNDFELPFTAETFLLSFSQPNFFFHVTTAYDLLRTNGIPLGKVDFMGPARIVK